MYEDYRILLDQAAQRLGLGFDDAAGALSDLVLNSPAQFAIGLFGVWGSGKTSLMHAIERRVEVETNAVPVWFNAWRYEREEHLIVPMLDTLRDALVRWSASQPRDQLVVERATKAASTVAKAARAIFAGITLKARIAGIEASLDANKVVSDWRRSGNEDDQATAVVPQSFYHASFAALEGAIGEFVGTGAERRIVVFIDDLDRCLPENALEVLESMKLFFDLPGFVFVVGLDQGVIERAVAGKFPTNEQADGAVGRSYVQGNYIKKLFQVQFAVPRLVEAQLAQLLDVITVDLPASQGVDVRRSVRPHLGYLTRDGSVNPREVKRFINDYTVQMKMLERKLGSAVPAAQPVPEVVLALLTMTFHPEWQSLYEQLVLDPAEFGAALKDYVDSGQSGAELQLGPTAVPLPASFVRYARNEGRSLAEHPLEVYVSSVEATASSDPAVLDATKTLRELRRAIGRADDRETRREIPARVSQLVERVASAARGPGGTETVRRVEQLNKEAFGIPLDPAEGWHEWRARAEAELTDVAAYLGELRRKATRT